MVIVATLAATVGLALGGLLTWARAGWVLVTVDGWSMVPTIDPGDRVLVRRVPHSKVLVGQVVVAEKPIDGEWSTSPLTVGSPPPAGRRWIVKRAVAGPGDPMPPGVRLKRDDGTGSVHPPEAAEGDGARVPPGHFVLLGDNRQDSLDSRVFGVVPGDRILGPVRRALSSGGSF
ncbi:signal peptidase I [Micromonospora sp. NPDC048947]|uniref:signal peptidase I n=1 Tax=Micromonospora sp. NPDC048947 TaxID=3154826 RepID=UPI003403D20F